VVDVEKGEEKEVDTPRVQTATIKAGDTLITVSVTQAAPRPPFKGIIKTVPGLIQSLMAFYTSDAPVSPYFIRMLFGLRFIQPVSLPIDTLDRKCWEITADGKAYVNFLCGEISE
jgi:hypothetical protein